MFVEISLDYEWHGKQTITIVVGSFDDKAAKAFQAGFQEIMLDHKYTGKVVLLNQSKVRPRFSPPITPKEVYIKMREYLEFMCIG